MKRRPADGYQKSALDGDYPKKLTTDAFCSTALPIPGIPRANTHTHLSKIGGCYPKERIWRYLICRPSDTSFGPFHYPSRRGRDLIREHLCAISPCCHHLRGERFEQFVGDSTSDSWPAGFLMLSRQLR